MTDNYVKLSGYQFYNNTIKNNWKMNGCTLKASGRRLYKEN